MKLLTVVTIYKFGATSPFERTVASLRSQSSRPFEHLLILSGVEDKELMLKKFRNEYTRLFINLDRSLYNAMNIGLLNASGDSVLFLNGGDELVNPTSLEDLAKFYVEGRCLAARVIQYHGREGFVRPSLTRIERLSRWPSHQGFVAPLPQAKRFPFVEEKHISADGKWMQDLILNFGVETTSLVVSKFALGGISNYPSMSSIYLRNGSEGIISAIKELLKLSLRLFLGDSRYYALILGYKSDRLKR
jgi:glycosyltransferase involved in cell wall biosynthesis